MCPVMKDKQKRLLEYCCLLNLYCHLGMVSLEKKKKSRKQGTKSEKNIYRKIKFSTENRTKENTEHITMNLSVG